MGVPLEVVSDTLGHTSIRVTMDVYGHLLAPAKTQAADAMQRALWLEDLQDFDPLAASLAASAQAETGDDAVTSDFVGRPGLDPGTLGLMGRKFLTRVRMNRTTLDTPSVVLGRRPMSINDSPFAPMARPNPRDINLLDPYPLTALMGVWITVSMRRAHI